MKHQSGFGLLTIVGGVFAAAMAAGLIYSYNDGQQAKVKLSQTKAELSDCKDSNSKLNALIAKQNEAVKVIEDTAAKAQARSKKAQETARNAVAATLAERDRLAKAAKAGGSCLDGVKAVRDGLSK